VNTKINTFSTLALDGSVGDARWAPEPVYTWWQTEKFLPEMETEPWTSSLQPTMLS